MFVCIEDGEGRGARGGAYDICLQALLRKRFKAYAVQPKAIEPNSRMEFLTNNRENHLALFFQKRPFANPGRYYKYFYASDSPPGG